MAKRDEVKVSILLNEYQACQVSIQALDSSLWQSAALIGLASLGTIALLASSPPPILVSLLVASFSTAASFTWRKIAERFWSLHDAKVARMRHIERILDTRGQVHYTDFLNDLHDNRSPDPVPSTDSRIECLAKKHGLHLDLARELASRRYERKGPRDRLDRLPWVTSILWSLFLSIQFAQLFWPAIRPYIIFMFFGHWSIGGA